MNKQQLSFDELPGFSVFIPLDDSITKKRTFPDSEIKGWVVNSYLKEIKIFFAYQRDSELNEGTFLFEDEPLEGEELSFQKDALLNEINFLNPIEFGSEIRAINSIINSF